MMLQMAPSQTITVAFVFGYITATAAMFIAVKTPTNASDANRASYSAKIPQGFPTVATANSGRATGDISDAKKYLYLISEASIPSNDPVTPDAELLNNLVAILSDNASIGAVSDIVADTSANEESDVVEESPPLAVEGDAVIDKDPTSDTEVIGLAGSEDTSTEFGFDSTAVFLASSADDETKPDRPESGTPALSTVQASVSSVQEGEVTSRPEGEVTSRPEGEVATDNATSANGSEASDTLCSSNTNRTDAYIDSVIREVARKLPPTATLPDRQGRLQLYDGKLFGLRTLRRIEPSVVQCRTRTSYTVLVPLQMSSARASYKWQVEMPLRTFYGDVRLDVSELSANIFYFRERALAKVEDLKILSMEGVRVEFTGLGGRLDGFVSGAARLLMAVFRTSFERAFERTLVDAVNVELNDVNKYQEFYE